MYRKTYVVELRKPGSIANAIEFLKSQKRLLEGKMWREFLELLGTKMEAFLDDQYSAGKQRRRVHVTHSVEDDNTLVVSANGKRMLFIEFGSGTPADSSEGVRYGFGAGSWSREHANTYQKWLDSGGMDYSVDGHYKYDREAKDAFMQLELALHRLIQESADEVYGN